MKKIKDTGLGKWLKNKAPNVLDVVGDFLPDQGALGALFLSHLPRPVSLIFFMLYLLLVPKETTYLLLLSTYLCI